MHTVLYTIGYQGADADALARTLVDADVKRLIDVRAVPISRKKGFSKHKLAALLADYSIAYTHLKALGTPKHGRDAAHAGNAAQMEWIFREHMKGHEQQLALQEMQQLAKESPSCLLCFEADPKMCHRSVLADMLVKSDAIEVVALKVNN